MKSDLDASTTAQLVQNLFNSQTERRAKQKALDLMEELEKSITAELIKRKLRSGEKIAGFMISVTKTDEPTVNSWPELIDYIKATGSVDLLEKRLLKSGAKLRLEDGPLPGVTTVEKTTLKVEKLA